MRSTWSPLYRESKQSNLSYTENYEYYLRTQLIDVVYKTRFRNC